jgi:uncharacterized radical SAM protein YgiQ
MKTTTLKQPRFLPMFRQEMQALGWEELDVLLVTGDAYVDHSSFGAALIGRFLVSLGYRTGIISQPDWKNPASVAGMGRPRLFAGVTAGAMDSMVSNYTANKKLRRDDAYSPGGGYGFRPNRASLIYTNLLKHAFPGVTIVLGGIEASLRRLAHYDYWEDNLRRSLLVDAKADILIYGMAERPIAEVARRLQAGEPLDAIAQTAIVRRIPPSEGEVQQLPGYEAILADKSLLMQATLVEEAERDWRTGKTLIQAHADRVVIVHPPAEPLSPGEMDAIYSLPFSRQTHPAYREKVPALEPVVNSIVTHRGCFGGCSFCALGSHQGKTIQSRTADNVLAEIRHLTELASFHGTVTDVGGPSANMYGLKCLRVQGTCTRPSCLFPSICRQLKTSHAGQMQLLRRALAVPGVRHVFIASGIRYDLALEDPGYISALVSGGHVSGMLKVAPEHAEAEVLKRMRKPDSVVFERFANTYREACRKAGKFSTLTAYFISAFPGSGRNEMEIAAEFGRRLHLRIEQMQDFIPLPMTLAGVMYYTGLDPWTGKPLRVEKSAAGRRQQRATLLGHAAGPVRPPRRKGSARRPGSAPPK